MPPRPLTETRTETKTIEGQPAAGWPSAFTLVTLAEDEGFEPSVSFPTHDFQSCALGH
jgi:hypothetical protein